MMKAQKNMVESNAEHNLSNKMDLLNRAKLMSQRNSVKTEKDVSELVESVGTDLIGANPKDVEKMVKDLVSAEFKNEELTKKMKSVDAERKKISKDLAKRDSELVKYRKEIDQLRADVKASKKENVRLVGQLDEVCGELSEARGVIESLTEEQANLLNTIKENDEYISGLLSTIRDYEGSEYGVLKEEIKGLNREIKHWQNEHRNMTISRDQLNTKHVAKLRELSDVKGKSSSEISRLEKVNARLLQSSESVKEDNKKLRERLLKVNETVSKLRKVALDLGTWPESDKRLMLRNIDKALFMDALVYRIQHEKGFRIPHALREVLEKEIEIDEIKRAKRDMAIVKLSNKKFSGFDRLTAVGVLLEFGDGTYGFKNINSDEEYSNVDVGRLSANVGDGVVVRVEILSDDKVRVVEVYSTKRGDMFYDYAKKRKKKVSGSRTDGFGVSDVLKEKLSELVGDKKVVVIGSAFSNTMREYLTKHVKGIEFVDAYEDGDRKTQSWIVKSDICILQPNKIPHTVVEVIEDKKDGKYVWANNVNPRELLRMLYIHLGQKD